MDAHDYADLALHHLTVAALLALNFALVSLAYLLAMWRLAGTLGRSLNLVLHTLFLGWQSNVAYLAVVTLHAGQLSLRESQLDTLANGWAPAPWVVPGAATLYTAVLLLCLAFSALRASARRHGS